MATSNNLNDFYQKYNALITFNNLQSIEVDIPFYQQRYILDEDIFQMECEKDIAIDIGWYWESEDYLFDNSVKGIFRIRVIKNMDWLNPLDDYSTDNFKKMGKILKSLAKKYCK